MDTYKWDRWRPEPTHQRGSGFITVGRVGGLCREWKFRNNEPFGYVTQDKFSWAIDSTTYQVLELCRRGHSEKYLRQQLQRVSKQQLREVIDFATKAGFLVSYQAKDARPEKWWAIASLTWRAASVNEEKIPGLGPFLLRNCDGELVETNPVEAAVWHHHEGWPISDYRSYLEEHGEDADPIAFWLVVRMVEAGLVWLDRPRANAPNVGAGWKDVKGHWIVRRPIWSASRPDRHGEWYLDEGKIGLATGLGLGNLHEDDEFQIRTATGQTHTVSRDAYAAFMLGDHRWLTDLATQMMAELGVTESDANRRVLAALEELRELKCIQLRNRSRDRSPQEQGIVS
jgi:hypothetical protein